MRVELNREDEAANESLVDAQASGSDFITNRVFGGKITFEASQRLQNQA